MNEDAIVEIIEKRKVGEKVDGMVRDETQGFSFKE